MAAMRSGARSPRNGFLFAVLSGAFFVVIFVAHQNRVALLRFIPQACTSSLPISELSA